MNSSSFLFDILNIYKQRIFICTHNDFNSMLIEMLMHSGFSNECII